MALKINMNHHFPVKKAGKPRILVAPLDWGLGHATRCIPLIRELLLQGAELWLAAEKAQATLLGEVFPDLPLLDLKGYRVQYARTARGMLWQMMLQSSSIRKSIREENKWLKEQVARYGFDAVISDNRYGLYHPGIQTVFITHQLLIRSPLGKWSESLLQKNNYNYIHRFSRCWVPDYPDAPGLAGMLSHPLKQPRVPVRYIGPLTRFGKNETAATKKHLLFLLSGPEPQRSILENIIIRQISHYSGTATIVRGLPGHPQLIPSTGMIRFYNHLDTAALQEEIARAEWVIGRSGYSSLMDLAALQKKCIFIPTPGQTEQEYLAGYAMEKGWALQVKQDAFALDKVLETASRFDYQPFPPFDQQWLKEAVQELMDQLPGTALG